MTTKIPLAGVIGAPVGHSRSPALHGHWLAVNGIKGHYVPLEVAPGDLANVLRMLPKIGFVGVNVTIPHKESMLLLADSVSDRAALIGAANTITFKEGKVFGDNTDGYGFMANLRQGAPEWEPQAGPAAVLGAGGASRAVIYSLIDAGVPEIRLANRNRSRAEALRKVFGPKVKVIDWDKTDAMFEGAKMVVNTTSLGMQGKPEFNLSLARLKADAIATDLVYTPLETGFLRAAAQIGCKTVDGLGMLLHQGAPGFERWFGVAPVVDAATRKVVLS
ncbi:MAG: shikimate dehydrogenase [Paracoccaceae bacterium]|jgi:shikimate dehydrogenase